MQYSVWYSIQYSVQFSVQCTVHCSVQYSLGVGCPGTQGVVTSQLVKTKLAMLHSFSTILLLPFLFIQNQELVKTKKSLSLWATV